jgi:pimeloyl-ACP methyl ester carboxylesterase
MPHLTTSDGRKLAWREVGSGPTLVCHPGGPGFSSHCLGDLSGLARERTLVLLDPRGTGDSDRPVDSSAYDLDHYADDLEALRRHLALERLDVLGHSHGGFVAMRWAGTHPERVGRLVLASTTPRFTDAIREARRARVASHAGQPYFEDAMQALQAHQEGRYANDAELAGLYGREWPLFVPLGFDAGPAFEALIHAGTNADALRHFNERVAPAMDQRSLLQAIGSPTLLIFGELDPFTSTAGEMADALPDATLVVVRGADHFVFLENDHRADWSKAVLEFLDS